MNDLNIKIKNIREDLSLSQVDFSNSLNISRSGLTQIEAGKTNPSFDLIYKIVKIYGVNPSYFFKEDNTVHFEQNNTQVNTLLNTPLSQNDLNILAITFFPSVDEVLPYLSMSEARIKAIFKDKKQELKEKVNTYNSIIHVALLLKIDYVLNKYDDKIDVSKYIKDIIEEYNPEEYKEGMRFDSVTIYTIVKILSLIEAIEHISYLTDRIVKYLKNDCEHFIKMGYIVIENPNTAKSYIIQKQEERKKYMRTFVAEEDTTSSNKKSEEDKINN